jgi:hypothetical protein
MNHEISTRLVYDSSIQIVPQYTIPCNACRDDTSIAKPTPKYISKSKIEKAKNFLVTSWAQCPWSYPQRSTRRSLVSILLSGRINRSISWKVICLQMVFQILHEVDSLYGAQYGTLTCSFVDLLLKHPWQNCCALKDSGPFGNLIYVKDNISIYEVDGQDHKVSSFDFQLVSILTSNSDLHPEFIPIRKTLPWHKVCVLRCHYLLILYSLLCRPNGPILSTSCSWIFQ